MARHRVSHHGLAESEAEEAIEDLFPALRFVPPLRLSELDTRVQTLLRRVVGRLLPGQL